MTVANVIRDDFGRERAIGSTLDWPRTGGGKKVFCPVDGCHDSGYPMPSPVNELFWALKHFNGHSTCYACMRRFPTEQGLRIHYAQIHKRDIQFLQRTRERAGV